MRTREVANGLAEVLGEERVIFLPDKDWHTTQDGISEGTWVVETVVSPEINLAGGREDTYTFDCTLYLKHDRNILWDKMDEIVDRFDMPGNRTLDGNVSNVSLNAATDIVTGEDSSQGKWGVVRLVVTAVKRVR